MTAGDIVHTLKTLRKDTGKQMRAVPHVKNNIIVQLNLDSDSDGDGDGECEER